MSSTLMLNWSHGLSSDTDAQELLDMRIFTSICANAFSGQGGTERSSVAWFKTTWDRCGKSVPEQHKLCTFTETLALCCQYVTYRHTDVFTDPDRGSMCKKGYMVHPFQHLHIQRLDDASAPTSLRRRLPTPPEKKSLPSRVTVANLYTDAVI